MFRHLAYGLTVESPVQLPAPRGVGSAEVSIVYARVNPDSALLPKEGLLVARDEQNYRLVVPGKAVFLCSEGCSIQVERLSGYTESVTRAFLISHLLPAVLMQRGFLVLRASAVEQDGAATLLLGEPGAGKTSLAKALIKNGCRLISDYVVAVGEAAHLPPGFPALLESKPKSDAGGESDLIRRGTHKTLASFQTMSPGATLQTLILLRSGPHTSRDSTWPDQTLFLSALLSSHFVLPQHLSPGQRGSLFKKAHALIRLAKHRHCLSPPETDIEQLLTEIEQSRRAQISR